MEKGGKGRVGVGGEEEGKGGEGRRREDGSMGVSEGEVHGQRREGGESEWV